MSLNDLMNNDDLDIFFDIDEFGIEAVVDGVAVNGIFDRPYIDGIEVSGYSPTFFCKTEDIGSIVEGIELTVDETDYVVVGIEPDGTGVTKLILQESA